MRHTAAATLCNLSRNGGELFPAFIRDGAINALIEAIVNAPVDEHGYVTTDEVYTCLYAVATIHNAAPNDLWVTPELRIAVRRKYYHSDSQKHALRLGSRLKQQN